MEEVVGLLFAWFFTLTGRLLVRVMTLGRWGCEPIGSKESSIHAPAGALSYLRDRRRIVTPSGQALIGFFFYFAFVAIALVRLSR